jgi:hypothetical protein
MKECFNQPESKQLTGKYNFRGTCCVYALHLSFPQRSGFTPKYRKDAMPETHYGKKPGVEIVDLMRGRSVS